MENKNIKLIASGLILGAFLHGCSNEFTTKTNVEKQGTPLAEVQPKTINIKNEQTKNEKESIKDLLVGTWSGTIDGSKLIWVAYPDGTEEYNWFHPAFTQTDVGDYSVEDDVLYEEYSRGGKTVCKLRFETNNHLVLTILDNGNPLDRNQKRHYYREDDDKKGDNRKTTAYARNRQIVKHKELERECSMPCPACNSQGMVPCNSIHTAPEDLRCVTQKRFSDCMTEPNPGSKFYVCCRCYGTGTWKYKCK
jgi:hypothetical protein